MKKILILLLTSSFLLSNNWFRGLENPNGPTGELTVSFRDISSLSRGYSDWGVIMPITNSATVHYYNLDEIIQVDLHIPLYKLWQ